MALRNILGLSAIMLSLAAGMFALGFWQLERMGEKEVLISDFEDSESLSLQESLESDQRFIRIHATGRFDDEKHVLLDNQVLNGRAGVHVLTPFTNFSGSTILVNRGWKPIPADRSSLPSVETPTVPVDISGILAPPPEHRQKLGDPDILKPDKWPQLVTYLDIDAVSQAMDKSLIDRVIWLDAADPNGFDGREWSPTTMKPIQHKAYAVQWFGLGIAALAIWLYLILRRKNENL